MFKTYYLPMDMLFINLKMSDICFTNDYALEIKKNQGK